MLPPGVYHRLTDPTAVSQSVEPLTALLRVYRVWQRCAQLSPENSGYIHVEEVGTVKPTWMLRNPRTVMMHTVLAGLGLLDASA